MVKNNKGVTLVELLIVIVVMGIIAAFSIPAVGTIITNTQKDAVLNDAIQVENAAKLYCSSNTCSATQSLKWSDIEDYVDGLDTTKYDLASGGVAGAAVVAVKDSGKWKVTLEGAGTDAATWDWEWTANAVPSDSDRTQVVMDAN